MAYILIRSKYQNYKVHFLSKKLRLKNQNNKIFIIDKKVKNIFFKKKNFANIITINANENAKALTSLYKIILKIKKLNGNKKTELHVIGGGVLQDLGAFIASIYMRGIKWIFYPTTLLSQADSCIGSKTSINLGKNKNLLGTFFPPKKILIYFNFLNSLSMSEVHSGNGELLKYFLLKNFIKKSKFKIFEKKLYSEKNFKELIFESLKIKKRYIEKDEFDENIRKHLNYGHTFGHAIESSTNYRIPHGIAITFGMDIANYISFKMKKISKKEYERTNFLLKKNFYKFENFKILLSKMIGSLKNDKKNYKKKFLTCILRFSKFNIVDIPLNKNFIEMLKKYKHLRFV